MAKKWVDGADTARKRLLRVERAINKNREGLSAEEVRFKLEENRKARTKAAKIALEKARQIGLDV